MKSKTVAALYTLARSSPYADMDGVDCWPIRRNALCYRGPGPVVAHPPCAPWSPCLAHQTLKSEEQAPWLAPCAVLQVRRYGGILEQPSRSRLWEKMGLPYPEGYHAKAVASPTVDRWGGFTIEVYQGDFGHLAPKCTWLYMVGIDRGSVVLPPRMQQATTERRSWRVDKRTGRGWWRPAFDLGSPQDRKRTPPAFAKWLVGLASTARVELAATGIHGQHGGWER